MIQPVNNQSYQALLNMRSAETAGEREHDGDSDDATMKIAAAQQKTSVLPYSPDMGTKVNVMA